MVIILKGMEREKCFEEIRNLQVSLEGNIHQKSVFVVGQLAEHMSAILYMYEKCVSMSGYFFFADWLPVTIFDAAGEVFGNKVQANRIQGAREEMITAMVDGDESTFDKSFSCFAKLVCRIADGKKEDVYYCTMIRLAVEKLADLGVDAGSGNDTKMLLELGRGTCSYTQLVEEYRKILIRFRERIQDTASNSEKKNYLKAKAYIAVIRRPMK